MSASAKPVPVPDALTAPFWEATRQGILKLQRCARCERYHHPPRLYCAACSGDDLPFAAVSGRGTVVSFAVMQETPIAGFEDQLPVIVASVELEEQDGLLLIANLLGSNGSPPAIGDAVHVTFEELSDGSALPQFVLGSDRA